MISLISIYIGGILTLGMAVFHTQFYKLFRWKADFKNITDLNQRILHTIHLALTLLFFLIGALTMVYAQELSSCIGISLGLNIILAILWLWRTIWQAYYFKGKILHYILVTVFFLLFASYLLPVIMLFAE
jgi:hypothetical protein